MVKQLSHYQDKAVEVIQSPVEQERLRMLRAMDNMYNGRWNLPKKVRALKWIEKVVSSDPYDAVRVGQQVLSAVQPRIKLQPLGPGADTQKLADGIERALLWHFRNASRRRRASVLRDITLSAILYDEVVAQVVFLPYQIKQLKAFKGQTDRLEAAKRFGPFSIIVRNPQQVHVKYSDWMAEEVILRRTVPLHEAVNFWGDKAKKLKKEMDKKDNSSMKMVTIFDFMDMKDRVVWAVPHENDVLPASAGDEQAFEFVREEHKIGFLPWVAVAGGSEMTDGEQRMPLLFPLYATEQWELQNIVETLMTSEVIAYASAPKYKVTGPAAKDVEVDYGVPGNLVYLPVGNDISMLQPPVIDQSMAAIAERVAGRIGKSTVPKVIFGDIPQGAAFASINIATQSGLKSLTPYKTLSEQALVGIFSQMLYWINKEGEKVTAFTSKDQVVKRADCAHCAAEDVNPQFNFQNNPELLSQFPNGTCPECGAPLERARSEQRSVTEQLNINPNDFDVDNIYIEVELTADVPTDRMARINAAAIAKNQLGLPAARGLESMGVEDPVQAREQARAEREEEFEEQLGYKEEEAKRMGAIQLQLQQQAAQIKMQQQQALARMQAEAEGGGEGGTDKANPNQRTRGRFEREERGRGFQRTENTRGAGFDRKADEGSLAASDPGNTRLAANQTDDQGVDLAGSQ